MNPLVRDRDVSFLLYDVLEVTALTSLPYFAEHSRMTFDSVLGAAARFAREVLYPAYNTLDETPPRFEAGRVLVHPRMRELWPALSELGLVVATRPAAVGGMQLPLSVFSLATAYLMAANLSAYGYVGLSGGAAHLLETFGNESLRERYMRPLYEGRWTGTMALTEPQAGSSLADVAALAKPMADGSFRMSGAKIFISGGDHDAAENIVHMTLARIDAPSTPAGTKGVSLFCVPKRRVEGDRLVDNDVAVTGLIHKIGWRGLPSVALSYGEGGDCHGYLVGEPHRGLAAMFQMMNEARIMVGMNGVATASVAYLESLEYAKTRRQGRPLMAKDPGTPPVPIVMHTDVRRMLLRQKAIVEGAMATVTRAALFADVAEHGAGAEQREHARVLLDLLTPVAKSFPAERGYEANALALQIHGGYGYSSEYPVEAWLRDQKLNSLHEGTTGIQAMDLLGRKAVAGGGAAMLALRVEVERTVERAARAGVEKRWCAVVGEGLATVLALTAELGARGAAGDVAAMMLHATDYLDLFSTLVVGWQHLECGAAATERLAAAGGGGGSRVGGAGSEEVDFLRGRILSMEYWLATEMPRIATLSALCRAGEDSYARISEREL
ncbi:MAG: acyl-CoA dehydrogenase [Myxococcales bacterium]|nr:acyl-CoA dehydrogenase [Myxococcales bacterium]